MQPEIVISQGTTTTTPPPDATIDIRALGSGAIGILEHEIVKRDATIADLRAALTAADARFATLLFRANADVERAEADVTALREGFIAVFYAQTIDERRKLRELAVAEHPGAPLLAELAAARASNQQTLDAHAAAMDVITQLRTELAVLRAVLKEADNGEWHSSKDCQTERRTHECTLCGALAAVKAMNIQIYHMDDYAQYFAAESIEQAKELYFEQSGEMSDDDQVWKVDMDTETFHVAPYETSYGLSTGVHSFRAALTGALAEGWEPPFVIAMSH